MGDKCAHPRYSPGGQRVVGWQAVGVHQGSDQVIYRALDFRDVYLPLQPFGHGFDWEAILITGGIVE